MNFRYGIAKRIVYTVYKFFHGGAMVSRLLITAGALMIIGSIVAMFFVQISGTLITVTIIGAIATAGGMFAKSTRGSDDIPGLENDGSL
jgi:hypothetical protein